MDCLKAIKEYAFVASPYPVIITLEDHLTSDLQAKVAQVNTFLSVKFDHLSYDHVVNVRINYSCRWSPKHLGQCYFPLNQKT